MHYHVSAGKSGFEIWFEGKPQDLFPNGFAEIAIVHPDTFEPLNPNQHIYLHDETKDMLPFPGKERRARVHGAEHEPSFRLEGFSSFNKVIKAYQIYSKSKIGPDTRILDWGCGCGRLSRYWSSLPDSQLTGIDIDRDNANWCASNFPFGNFLGTQTHPPTPFEDDSFDLIIGISVFTHLREHDQKLWLKELYRITNPGGWVLTTIQGMSTACRMGLEIDKLLEWQRNGIQIISPNNDLGDAIPDTDFYVNTLHSLEYLWKTWTEFFAIKGLIEGHIGNHQDLVLLQKPIS